MIGRAAFLRDLDPRLKMGAGLLLGILFWKAAVWAVLPVTLGLAWAVVPFFRVERGRGHLRGVILFVLAWVGIKSGVDALAGSPLSLIAVQGADLAVRLAGLILLGFVLSLSTSPRSMGMALNWFLRPMGRDRSWRVALSLALMVHFMPMGLRVVSGVREAASLRCPDLSLRRRFVVLPLAVLRNMSRSAWDQTLAVASRGLDRAEAWTPAFVWTGRDSAALAVLYVMAVVLAVV